MRSHVPAPAPDREREVADPLGETAQATILFVDVVGSLERSASVRPQEWWALMHGVMGVMSDVVHDAGGWVERFTGDGMKAVFGAPLDGHRHAAQACTAALRLRRDLARLMTTDHDLAVRIGLHTGEVVTGLLGSGLSLQYAAMGYTAALAQRVESAARPWGIFLSAETAALVCSELDVRGLGPVAIKGRLDPMPVFELHG